MPDNKREEKSLRLFLEYYNSVTGKQYIKDCRPEERDDIVGNYDFSCKDKSLRGVDLAIEEKSLNKASETVRDSKEIREIRFEVERILDGKGLHANDKNYSFFLEFKEVPGKKEREKYARKIADCIEKVINENKGCDTCDRVTFNMEGYNCIKEFRLIRVSKGKGILFSSTAESDESTDEQSDTSERLAEIFKNSNKQLGLPKRERKKTILLITNDWDNFVGADEYNISAAIQSINQKSHEHIDEIFFINKRNLQNGYDIHKVK